MSHLYVVPRSTAPLSPSADPAAGRYSEADGGYFQDDGLGGDYGNDYYDAAPPHSPPRAASMGQTHTLAALLVRTPL